MRVRALRSAGRRGGHPGIGRQVMGEADGLLAGGGVQPGRMVS